MGSRTSFSSSAKRRRFRRGFFRGTQARRAPASRTRPLAIEPLEKRALLAVVIWDGALDGGGPSVDANWTTPSNWAGDLAPNAGDDLVFAGITQQTNNNNFAAGTTFKSITLNNGGFDLQGNALVLDGAGTAELLNLAGSSMISLDFTLDDSADDISTIEFTAGEVVIAGSLLDSNDTDFVISGAGKLTLGPAAVVNFDGNIDLSTGSPTLALSASDPIDDNATLIVEQGSIFDLGSFNETVGSVELDGGWIRPATGQLTANSYDVRAGTVDAVLAGAGTLDKSSAGTVTLNEDHTYTGATTIQAGRLDVNGSTVAASTLEVQDTGTLGGTGTVNGTVTVEDGGTISPAEAAAMDTLATGAVDFKNNSTFDVEIISGTGHDQLAVTGTVTIGTNVALNLSDPQGAFSALPGDELVIIDNDAADAITGTFQGLAEGAVINDFLGNVGATAHVTYVGGTGNDVAIVVDAVPVEVTLVGGVAGPEDFTLRVVGANLRLTDGIGAPLLNVPLAGVTELTINAEHGEDDTLVIDFSGGNPIPEHGIEFNGHVADDDALEIKEGDFSAVTTTYTSVNDGIVELDGDEVRFIGLSPLLINAGTVDKVIFNLPLGPNGDVEIGDNGNAADNISQISGTTFETTGFTNPKQSLTINLGPLGDTIAVLGLDPGFSPTGEFAIVGGVGADTFNVESPQRVVVDGGPGSDRLWITDEGPGDVTLIRKGPHGQSGSAIVAPAGTPLGPVVFDAVEYVQVTPVDAVSGGTGTTDKNGRVVELDPDPLEMNNTRQNATSYDLLAQIDVQPAIDPGGDEDWYSFVATEDSSYRFSLQFDEIANPMTNGQPGLPDNGELQLDVYDKDGIFVPNGTGVPVASGKAVTLSLRAQETYYARVRGIGGAVNLYDLDITNTRTTFENGPGQFEPLSGLWTVDREGLNASYRGASDPTGNAIALFKGPVPANSDNKVIEVTINADEMIAGPRWSNAFIVFDLDPTDLTHFKFAGAFKGIDRWAIGDSANNANGYVARDFLSERIDANTDYRIRVELNTTLSPGNTTVILSVHDGLEWQEKTRHEYLGLFAAPNDGVGLLTMRGIAWFDDFADPDPGGVVEQPEPVEPNAVPVARDDSVATSLGQAVTIDVLANDIDADGDPLVPAVVAAAANGTVALDPDGSFLYTPEPAFHGTDGFTYRVNDGQIDSDPATVSIVVDRPNRAPLAARDEASTNEDAAVTVDVLSNDADPDADPLTVISFTQAAHGSVVRTGGGALTYTPERDFDRTDSFTYKAADGRGGTAVATVEIMVNPVNDPPVATPDALSTAENTPSTIDVAANDSDPENDTIVVIGHTQGAYGTVDMPAGDGRTMRYTPTAGFRGVDRFNYTIGDGRGGADTATVSVSVGGILLHEDFDHALAETPQVEAGSWRIVEDPSGEYAGDRCYLATAPSGGNALVAQAVEGSGPLDLDVQVTFNAEDVVPGRRWSNAFVIFDYQSPTDFKFAGAFVGINGWAIGHSARNANGYVVDKVFSERIDARTDYAVQVLIEDNTVTLGVHDGQRYVPKVIHTYSDSGDSLQDGSVGLGTMKGTARFDDLQVKATDRVFGELGSVS